MYHLDFVTDREKTLQNPLKHLKTMKINIDYHNLIFKASDIRSLEIYAPQPRFPEVSSAPELARYYDATGGLKLCISPFAHPKTGFMGMDYEWDPRYFDYLKTMGYAYIDDIVLDYSNYRQDNQFITICPPCLLDEGKSAWPDKEKNLLASAWQDDTGALIINFSSTTA
ncbi:hypothetical protein [Selenomonas sp. KH1T6]|uniref:hypothetical protein n=1 Tax=Selenomonas sp. KH1T6 TaxID=3158784 RepID=UPI0008A7CF29|nr:hypothetical protein SAMN05216583_1573 [Selenomonas ruminantium]